VRYFTVVSRQSSRQGFTRQRIRTLQNDADAPKQCLDEKEQSKIDDVARELWRRLEDALGENSESLMALRSRRPGDNTGDGPATADGLQAGLFDDPYIPF
jgi:hypothetical protein